MKFVKLFGRLKSNIIGMIHVGALPGRTLGLECGVCGVQYAVYTAVF